MRHFSTIFEFVWIASSTNTVLGKHAVLVFVQDLPNAKNHSSSVLVLEYSYNFFILIASFIYTIHTVNQIHLIHLLMHWLCSHLVLPQHYWHVSVVKPILAAALHDVNAKFGIGINVVSFLFLLSVVEYLKVLNDRILCWGFCLISICLYAVCKA